MKILKFLFLLFPLFIFSQCKCDPSKKKFTKEELVQDLHFIKEKIKTNHINPYSYINEETFDKEFVDIENKLDKKTKLVDFQKMIWPIFVNLSDDHASIDRFYVTNTAIPLNLKYYNNKLLLTDNFSSQNLDIGDDIISVNNIKINEIIDKCSNYSLGNRTFKNQLTYNQFIYLMENHCMINDSYTFQFSSGKTVTFDKNSTKKDLPQYRINFQLDELNDGAVQHIKYRKIDDNNGYLEVNTFSFKGRTYTEWKNDIDKAFDQIKQDNIKNLYIDVSKNSGGSVNIGKILIYRFSDKKYKSFTFKSNKSKDAEEQQKTYDKLDSTKRKIIFPEILQNRFKGKTYIIVGQRTFSAALIFATTVLDNNLATVIGETIEEGHPNHFGEVLKFQTPNTKLNFSISAGETKRPDETKPNQLIPNIEIDLTNKKIEDIITFVENYSSQKN